MTETNNPVQAFLDVTARCLAKKWQKLCNLKALRLQNCQNLVTQLVKEIETKRDELYAMPRGNRPLASQIRMASGRLDALREHIAALEALSPSDIEKFPRPHFEPEWPVEED